MNFNKTTRIAIVVIGILMGFNLYADVASDSFANTLAFGERHWGFQNATVTLEKSTGIIPSAPTTSTFNCNSNALNSSGSYPNYLFSLRNVRCDGGQLPLEVSGLFIILGQLSYTAVHIPAGTIDPNQFRLVLSTQELAGLYPQWKTVRSLNALTRDNELFVDLVGEVAEASGLFGLAYYYLSVSIRHDQATGQNTLSIYYSVDDFFEFSNPKRFNIEMEVQLQTVN